MTELKNASSETNEVRGKSPPTWAEIDARRAELKISRAAFCRRANISESTMTKGIKAGVRPIKSRWRWVRLVLEARRHELLAEMGGGLQ